MSLGTGSVFLDFGGEGVKCCLPSSKLNFFFYLPKILQTLVVLRCEQQTECVVGEGEYMESSADAERATLEHPARARSVAYVAADFVDAVKQSPGQ